MADDVLCDACDRAHALTVRNCEVCGRLLDKRMWRFAEKVEKEYRSQGLARSRALVEQRARTLRIELVDASSEAIDALAEKTRQRFRSMYGYPRARQAGFEKLVFTNGSRTEELLVPSAFQHLSDVRGVTLAVAATVVLVGVAVVWCLARLALL